MPPQIIAICGKARSGKDTAADVIAEWFSQQVSNGASAAKVYKLYLAEPIKANVKVEGLSKEDMRKAWQDYGRKMREEHGQSYFAKELLKKADEITKTDPNAVFVIPDVRLIEECEEFKTCRVPLKVIQIDSTLHSRLSRMKSTEDMERYVNETMNDITETSFDSYPKHFFRDMILENNGSLDQFSDEIENYMYQDFVFGG